MTGRAPTAEDRETLVVGLLFDEVSRALADELAQQLPEQLGERFPGRPLGRTGSGRRTREPTATTSGLLRTVRRRLPDKDAGIGLTELPLHTGRRPVTACASATRGVGLVSVPALGASGRERRLEGLIGEYRAFVRSCPSDPHARSGLDTACSP